MKYLFVTIIILFSALLVGETIVEPYLPDRIFATWDVVDAIGITSIIAVFHYLYRKER